MSDLLAVIEPVDTGAELDKKNQSAMLWQEAKNVVFRAKKIMPFPGSVPLFPRGAEVEITGLRDLPALVFGTAPGIVYGTLNKLYLWKQGDMASTEKGSGYTGSLLQTASAPATRWSFEDWGSWVLATNGVDTPQIYKGTSFSPMSTFAAQYGTAEIFIKWRQYLIAMNLQGGKNRIAWSASDNPEEWLPASNNLAGSLPIRDIENDIVTSLYLGDTIAFYSQHSMHGLSFLGPPFVFGSHRALTGIGAVGKNAVCDVGRGQHIGVGPRGIWMSDGVASEYFDSQVVRETFMREFNADQGSKVVCYLDQTLKHVLIFYPQIGFDYNSAGLVFNMEEGKWSRVALLRTVCSDRGVFSFAVSADKKGQIYKQTLLGVPFNEPETTALGVTDQVELISGYGEMGFGELGYGGAGISSETNP